LVPAWLHQRMGLTLLLIAILGGIFLRGFHEAMGIAVVVVALYMGLNAVLVVVGFYQLVVHHPHALEGWKTALFTAHASALAMLGVSALLFPKLALGLSGFETGVAVMPLVRGNGEGDLEGRVRNTKRLLITAAVIMSVFLLSSSLLTTLLIP